MGIFRRIRGALGLGLVFAVAWGAVGGAIEFIANLTPAGSWVHGVDMWIPLLAMPGFACGVLTAGVLMAGERRSHFGQLSIPRFAAWGAAGGMILGAIALWNLNPTVGFGVRAIVTAVPLLLGAASAAGTLAIARRGEDRALIAPGVKTDEVGLTDRERQELLGR